MNLLFPAPRSGKSRKVVRSLRKARRALGPCRNLDVNLELIQEKIAAAVSETAKDAWAQVRDALLANRAAELVRARDELRQSDIVKLIDRVMSSIDNTDHGADPETHLKQQTERYLNEWSDALAAVQEDPQVEHIHALRIAGKRARYSSELLVELGQTEAKSLVKSFKALQDQLGRWHDLQVLMEFVAQFISQADFLLNHPDYGRYLLTEIDREKQRTPATVNGILESAAKIRNHWAERRLKDSDTNNQSA
jgi:CHAD domain-containing protein